MVREASSSGRFSLEIPIDASKALQQATTDGVPEGDTPRAVKVQVLSGRKILETQTVKIDAKGQGLARFDFTGQPSAVKVLVGAATTGDEELEGLEHLSIPVSARPWKAKPALRIPAIIIPYHHWHCWLFCCRTFTIRGRVLCADNKPVPNALVTAFDVDWFWWWMSKESVGSSYTDLNGEFTIKFRWCCSWLPLWWWRRRRWLLDPGLYRIIADELRLDPHIPWPPRPITKPDLSSLENLIKGHGKPIERMSSSAKTFDPGVLEPLRQRLLSSLPPLKDAERLHLWPWFPWYPWHDCTPDILFKVTQDCQVSGEVIVEETLGDIRWNIPTSLNVTLHANDKACCLGDPDPDPAGECVMIDGTCYGTMTQIGGNNGAPADLPAGYLEGRDRPFAGTVTVNGKVGDEVDYYAFDYLPDGELTWKDLPQDAMGAFYWQYIEPIGPPPWPVQNVPVRKALDGRLVYEGRHHYETTHDPLSWFPIGNRSWVTVGETVLMPWLTTSTVENGTLKLRARGYKLDAGGHLVPDVDPLPFCGSDVVVPLTLAIDNRKVGDGSGHPPSSWEHPCGEGSIHACTLEPDAAILSVKINGVEVNACGIVHATDDVPDGPLEIVFAAYDHADEDNLGHLDRFTLTSVYGHGSSVDLLGLGGTLTAGPASGGIPPADFAASEYWQAVSLGAPRPKWRGGVFKLTIPHFKSAFPVPCSYSLELWAYKRNVVTCSIDQFWNRSVMTFAVTR